MDAGDYHSWNALENNALSLLGSTDKLNWFTRGIAKNVYDSKKSELGDTPTQQQVDTLNIPGNIKWLQNEDYITGKEASSFKNQFNNIYNKNWNYDSTTNPTTNPTAKPQASFKDNLFESIDTDYDIGVEAPPPDTVANNYNTPSLLGNAQAAEENVGEIAAGTVAAKAVKDAGNWWNKGKDSTSNLKSLGGQESKAKIFGNKGLLQNDLRQLTRTDAAFKAGDKGFKGLRPAKAFTSKMLQTGPSPFVRQAVARTFGRVPALSALMPGTAGLTQEQEMESIGLNPDGSPIAGWQNPYGLSQFMNNNPYNNQKNLLSVSRDRGLEEAITKDKRNYRLAKRQKAQEAVAAAQAVAKAQEAKAEAARQAEIDRQNETNLSPSGDSRGGTSSEDLGGTGTTVDDAYDEIGDYAEYDNPDDSTGPSDSGGGSSGGSGGGSYIATATTQALGEEGLTVFNNWRDHMRNVVPEFTVSFGRYRVTAPKIVTAIDKKDNSKAIYKDIWDKHLKPIYDLIVADKDSVKAQDDYRVMVRELSNKHLKDKR